MRLPAFTGFFAFSLLAALSVPAFCIGGGIGIITAREVLLLAFPGFAPGWF